MAAPPVGERSRSGSEDDSRAALADGSQVAPADDSGFPADSAAGESPVRAVPDAEPLLDDSDFRVGLSPADFLEDAQAVLALRSGSLPGDHVPAARWEPGLEESAQACYLAAGLPGFLAARRDCSQVGSADSPAFPDVALRWAAPDDSLGHRAVVHSAAHLGGFLGAGLLCQDGFPVLLDGFQLLRVDSQTRQVEEQHSGCFQDDCSLALQGELRSDCFQGDCFPALLDGSQARLDAAHLRSSRHPCDQYPLRHAQAFAPVPEVRL
jgi:hypothetical protein